MKKILFMIAAAVCAAACTAPNSYTIKCERADVEGNIMLVIDTTETTALAKDGKVEFSGTIDEERFGLLLNEERQPIAQFVVEPGVITINDNGVSGTPSNDAVARLSERLGVLVAKFYDPATSEEERMAIQQQFRPTIDSAFNANVDNFASVALLNQMLNEMSLEELRAAIDRLSPKMKEHTYIKMLTEQLSMLASLEPGGEYVDFESVTMDGGSVSISALLAEGKYVLIDFWASWCGPCMREMPYLKETYKAFGGKNFEIVGFSLDEKDEDWRKAAASLPWVHCSDLQGFASPVARIYNVQSIPSNFLVAPDGTIVEKNLRGDAVKQAVAKYVK